MIRIQIAHLLASILLVSSNSFAMGEQPQSLAHVRWGGVWCDNVKHFRFIVDASENEGAYVIRGIDANTNGVIDRDEVTSSGCRPWESKKEVWERVPGCGKGLFEVIYFGLDEDNNGKVDYYEHRFRATDCQKPVAAWIGEKIGL